MIRDMRPEDISGVLDIEKTLPGRQWTARAFEESLQQDYTYFYVAETEQKKITGYCCVQRLYDEAELVNIAAAPACRRHGTGTALLRHMICSERQAGTRSIVLEVRQSNAPAISIYERAGFVKIGIRRNFYEFPAEDALIMQLLLHR